MSLGWILTCATSSNPRVNVINVQCALLDRGFYLKNDHFYKKSEAKSKSHLKVPAAKPNENTLVTKDLTSHSHTSVGRKSF